MGDPFSSFTMLNQVQERNWPNGQIVKKNSGHLVPCIITMRDLSERL